jgi:hypothetical protein
MPDYMDQLVDAQTQLDLADAESRKTKSKEHDKNKALLDEGAMTVEAARRITDSIKAASTATWILIKRAHDGKAWKSLDYDTWAEYVTSEFNISSSRSYQLINQANVISDLEAVAPEGTHLMLTEAQTRDIKDTLPKITEKIKNQTSSHDDPSVTADKINKIVEEERSTIKSDAAMDTKDEPVNEDTKNDAFQDLDSKGSAPKPDRMSAKSSGSTADDPIDLDADLPEDDFTDQLNDYSDVSSDDMNEDQQTMSYLFSYFDMLSDSSKVAKTFNGDLKTTKTQVDKIIKWFTDFRRQLGRSKN